MCASPESVDHIFFQCPIIMGFWTRVLTHHPQQPFLHVTSLLNSWDSCLFLSNFQYWGTLLATSIWVIWLEQNKKIFFSSSTSSVANIYFLILHLYKFWTDTSAHLEHILFGDFESSLTAPTCAPSQPGVGSTSTSDQPIISKEDEDLLDWIWNIFCSTC
jgi:hypothetical protein